MLDDMFDDLDRLEEDQAQREASRQKQLDEQAAAWRAKRAEQKRNQAERLEATREEARRARAAAREEARREDAAAFPSLGDLLASLDACDDQTEDNDLPIAAPLEVVHSEGRSSLACPPAKVHDKDKPNTGEVPRMEDLLAMLDQEDTRSDGADRGYTEKDESDSCQAERCLAGGCEAVMDAGRNKAGAADTADDEEWVVQYEGGVAVRTRMDRSSELLAVKYAGDSMRGRREGEWLVLASEAGFMSLGKLDGKGCFRDSDGDVLLMQTSHRVPVADATPRPEFAPPTDAITFASTASDAEALRLAARQRLLDSCGKRWPGISAPAPLSTTPPVTDTATPAAAAPHDQAATPALNDLLASLEDAENFEGGRPAFIDRVEPGLGKEATAAVAYPAFVDHFAPDAAKDPKVLADPSLPAANPLMAFVPMPEEHIALKNERRARLDAKAQAKRERRQRMTQEVLAREIAKKQIVQMPRKVPIGNGHGGPLGQQSPAAPPSQPAPKAEPRTKDFGRGLKGGFFK